MFKLFFAAYLSIFVYRKHSCRILITFLVFLSESLNAEIRLGNSRVEAK